MKGWICCQSLCSLVFSNIFFTLQYSYIRVGVVLGSFVGYYTEKHYNFHNDGSELKIYLAKS